MEMGRERNEIEVDRDIEAVVGQCPNLCLQVNTPNKHRITHKDIASGSLWIAPRKREHNYRVQPTGAEGVRRMRRFLYEKCGEPIGRERKGAWEYWHVEDVSQIIQYYNRLSISAQPQQPEHVQRDGELEQVRSQQEEAGAFAPADLEDARKRILAAIVLRQGQRTFRDQLLAAYRQICAVTGCDVVEALEAAHIVAYRGPETNHVTNGLLLRADIHILFDLGLLAVHPQDYRLMVSRRLKGTAYASLDGQMLRLPTNHAEHPSREALEFHMAVFRSKESESGPA